jgi:predicted membrane channel-forming protein YqfA (hemolysin III family)
MTVDATPSNYYFRSYFSEKLIIIAKSFTPDMQLKKTWQKFTLLNISLVLGLIASLFVVPGNTPLGWLAVVFGASVAVMNCLLFARLRKPTGRESASDSRLSTVIVSAGVVIFLLDLLLTYIHRSH